MSRKSDKEFWTSRMRPRFRIYSKVHGVTCEISASNHIEALVALGWRKEHCIIVDLGKMQQLVEPKWYVRNTTPARKDIENE